MLVSRIIRLVLVQLYVRSSPPHREHCDDHDECSATRHGSCDTFSFSDYSKPPLFIMAAAVEAAAEPPSDGYHPSKTKIQVVARSGPRALLARGLLPCHSLASAPATARGSASYLRDRLTRPPPSLPSAPRAPPSWRYRRGGRSAAASGVARALNHDSRRAVQIHLCCSVVLLRNVFGARQEDKLADWLKGQITGDLTEVRAETSRTEPNRAEKKKIVCGLARRLFGRAFACPIATSSFLQLRGLALLSGRRAAAFRRVA